MISPELLRRFPLFAGQSFYMLDEIAMISKELVVKEDDWIFYENEEAINFYLILEGEIALTLYVYYNGSGRHLQTTSPLTKPQLFGWSALVKPHHYKMGARATKDSKLLVIDGPALRQLLEDNPEYGFLFIRNLAEEIGERMEYKCIQVLSMILDPKKETTEKTKDNNPS